MLGRRPLHALGGPEYCQLLRRKLAWQELSEKITWLLLPVIFITEVILFKKIVYLFLRSPYFGVSLQSVCGARAGKLWRDCLLHVWAQSEIRYVWESWCQWRQRQPLVEIPEGNKYYFCFTVNNILSVTRPYVLLWAGEFRFCAMCPQNNVTTYMSNNKED